MIRWLSILAAMAAVGLMWWVAATAYPRLPPRIPVHFDGSGVPDRWTDSSPGEWFLLPIIGTGMALLLVLIGRSMPWLASNYPGIINVPKAKLFRELDAPARVRVLAPMSHLMEWTSALVCVLFASILWGSFEVAIGTEERLSPIGLYVGLPGYLVLVGVFSWFTRTAIIREWAMQETARSSAP